MNELHPLPEGLVNDQNLRRGLFGAHLYNHILAFFFPEDGGDGSDSSSDSDISSDVDGGEEESFTCPEDAQPTYNWNHSLLDTGRLGEWEQHTKVSEAAKKYSAFSLYEKRKNFIGSNYWIRLISLSFTNIFPRIMTINYSGSMSVVLVKLHSLTRTVTKICSM